MLRKMRNADLWSALAEELNCDFSLSLWERVGVRA